MNSKFKISQKKKSELEDRLDYLLTVRKKEVEEFSAGTGVYESWHQAGYAENIKKTYMKEVQEVQEILRNCEVIDENTIDKSKVGIGVTIILQSGDGQEMKVKIVSSVEVEPKRGWVSLNSPLGMVLRGKRIGDKVTLSNGEEFVIQNLLTNCY